MSQETKTLPVTMLVPPDKRMSSIQAPGDEETIVVRGENSKTASLHEARVLMGAMAALTGAASALLAGVVVTGAFAGCAAVPAGALPPHPTMRKPSASTAAAVVALVFMRAILQCLDSCLRVPTQAAPTWPG